MKLCDIIKNHVKTFKDLPNVEKYYINTNNIKHNLSVSNKNNILSTITELSIKFSDDIVFYGGVMCYPEIMGYKKHLRLASDDLDCAFTLNGLLKLKNDKLIDDCFYIKEFDAGFLDYKGNVPIGISYNHIHDWNISQKFFDSAVKINGASFCSPEYLITLKLRRNHSRLNEGKKLMGKDYVDIISLFASNTPLNLDEVKNLICLNISNNVEELREIIIPLKKYIRQAKNSEIRTNQFIKLF
jgi:hypothetical protein